MAHLRPEEVGEEHVLLDVRSPGEFESESVPGSENIPLSKLSKRYEEFVGQGNLVLLCATGMRAEKARQILASRGVSAQVLEGGIKEWARRGLPTMTSESPRLSLERQVRIVAGTMVALGGFLAVLIHPYFALLSAMIGCGLVFAGITDTCGLALLLAKLPYNARGRAGDLCHSESRCRR